LLGQSSENKEHPVFAERTDTPMPGAEHVNVMDHANGLSKTTHRTKKFQRIQIHTFSKNASFRGGSNCQSKDIHSQKVGAQDALDTLDLIWGIFLVGWRIVIELILKWIISQSRSSTQSLHPAKSASKISGLQTELLDRLTHALKNTLVHSRVAHP
jgi:hypothetical protein